MSRRYAEEIEALKKEARDMLISGVGKLSEKLVLIDTIERLGLSYHFEQEIQDQLTLAFNGYIKLQHDDQDLHIVALHFRLLRLHFFDVPSCKCLYEYIYELYFIATKHNISDIMIIVTIC